MVLTDKLKMRLSIVLAIVCWFVLTYLDIFFLYKNPGNPQSPLLARIFQALFFTFLYFYFRYTIAKAENFNFLDLLWKVFVTGLIAKLQPHELYNLAA